MPLAKGQPWGRPGVLPPDAPVVSSDAQLAAAVFEHLALGGEPREVSDIAPEGNAEEGLQPPLEGDQPREPNAAAQSEPLTVGLVGGDIWRACGSPAGGAARLREGPAHVAPVDILRLRVDDQDLVAAAHVVIRRPVRRGGWLGGDVVVVANGEWLGEWKIVPAAHPGDGWVYVLVVTRAMTTSQRLLARDRAPRGDHVPHDDIDLQRSRRAEFTFEPPQVLVVDGVRRGKVHKLEVEVAAGLVEVVF